ncbi:MAG: glycosyltransferase [Rikenellaceae bacterium]
MLLISVVIPVYRVERYLRECVDSVLNQSYRALEVILVDDGSPDSSPQICDEYAGRDSRVKVIHKTNGGLSDARNGGMEMATGDYILFLDSDDYWDDSKAVERGVAMLESNPEIDMLYFECKQLYGNQLNCKPPIDISRVNGQSKVEAMEYLIAQDRFIVTAWSKFVRRSIVVDNSLEFKLGLLSEDYDWNFKILIHSKVIWMMESDFYIYRMRDDSIISTMSTKHLFDILSIVEEWERRIPREVVDHKEAEVYMDFVGYIYGVLFSLIYICRDEESQHQLVEQMRPYAHLLKRGGSGKLRKLGRLYSLLGFSLSWRAMGVFNEVRQILKTKR